MKNLDFFFNKKILITGHTGFKGSWLVKFLLNFHPKILGISLPKLTNPSLFEILNLKKKITDVRCDIRNYKKIEKIIKKFKPEFIFHLAAESILLRSYKDPHATFTTNFNGTLNIIEIAKKIKGLKGIVLVTTDKCYKISENRKTSYKENDALGGTDPYSASKAACEILSESYREQFSNNNVGFATARAGNVVGGGDWSYNRIVPDIVRAIQKNKKIILRNPSQIRPWHHVYDCIYGYLNLMIKISQNSKKFSGAYNFGPSIQQKKVNVMQLTKIFLKYFNLPAKQKIIIKKNKKIKETQCLMLNTMKSSKVLKIKAKYNFNKAIQETANWYKDFINRRDIKSYTDKQILNYLKLK